MNLEKSEIHFLEFLTFRENLSFYHELVIIK